MKREPHVYEDEDDEWRGKSDGVHMSAMLMTCTLMLVLVSVLSMCVGGM